MVYEWITPICTAAGALICVGVVQQMAVNTASTLNALVIQNRTDHKDLFDEIKAERKDRSEEDNSIRRDFVSWQKCQDCPARLAKCVREATAK